MEGVVRRWRGSRNGRREGEREKSQGGEEVEVGLIYLTRMRGKWGKLGGWCASLFVYLAALVCPPNRD